MTYHLFETFSRPSDCSVNYFINWTIFVSCILLHILLVRFIKYRNISKVHCKTFPIPVQNLPSRKRFFKIQILQNRIDRTSSNYEKAWAQIGKRPTHFPPQQRNNETTTRTRTKFHPSSLYYAGARRTHESNKAKKNLKQNRKSNSLSQKIKMNIHDHFRRKFSRSITWGNYRH